MLYFIPKQRKKLKSLFSKNKTISFIVAGLRTVCPRSNWKENKSKFC